MVRAAPVAPGDELRGILSCLHASPEQVHVQFLESSPGDGGVEVYPFVQGVDLDGGLGGGGEGALRTLAGSAEAAEGAGVADDVLLVLALELGDEVVDEAVVEVLAAEMGVASDGLDLEDALLDGKEGEPKGGMKKGEPSGSLASRNKYMLKSGYFAKRQSGSWLFNWNFTRP